ncbi:hypothetical protein Tco_1096971 [Tanacetum coccineum]
MYSESTSSGTSRCLLTPSSKVKFQHHESNIAYNNAVALLEHLDDVTKYILFSLSIFENQLSFTRFDFLTAIGLTDSKSAMPLPPKGTVRVGLATLWLADKDKPSLTSIELVNSSPLKLKYFSPI